MVVYFPVHEREFYRAKRDVSIWEQVALVVMMQKYWSDNQVSATITFDPVTEGQDIRRILEIYDRDIKSISFLPMVDDVYLQMPYTEISCDEYDEYMAKIKPISFGNADTNEVVEKFCDSDRCQI